MKYFFTIISLIILLFIFKDELSSHGVNLAPAPKIVDPFFEEKIPEENRFWCRDGFKIENFSHLAEIKILSAFEEVNSFMGRRGMFHKDFGNARCKIIGVDNLAAPKVAEVLSDGIIQIDVPKVIEFCRLAYSNEDYANCWKMFVKHECLHELNVIHEASDDIGVMSPNPNSLNFTYMDKMFCEKSNICKAYLLVR